MGYVFALWEPPALAVRGSADLFPVRRIYCVGRNNAAHAREMGWDPETMPPTLFDKAADTLVGDGGVVPYAPATADLQHEVELVVAIGKAGAAVPPDQALDLVFGYAVGLDMTRRDMQRRAHKAGEPTDMAKNFDGAAPCGDLHRAADIGHPASGAIRLDVNGETRQLGDIANMVWNVPRILSEISKLSALAPGDLIYTGTPEGVGPVVVGDRLEGRIEGVGSLSVTIGKAR